MVQSFAVYVTYDFRENTNLYHWKVYYCVTCFLSIWCHLQASFTNPGKIIHHNNTSVINFYLNTHSQAMKNAEKFNRKVGHMFFPTQKDNSSDPESDEEVIKTNKKARKEKKKKGKESKEESDNSSYDDNNYKPVSAIGEAELKNITEDHKIELTRCKQCFVVRILRAHHCPKCKG